jgi:hypothetical protein
VIEGHVTLPLGGKAPAEAARPLEQRDLRVGADKLAGAGEPCHACSDHRYAHVGHWLSVSVDRSLTKSCRKNGFAHRGRSSWMRLAATCAYNRA